VVGLGVDTVKGQWGGSTTQLKNILGGARGAKKGKGGGPTIGSVVWGVPGTGCSEAPSLTPQPYRTLSQNKKRGEKIRGGDQK